MLLSDPKSRWFFREFLPLLLLLLLLLSSNIYMLFNVSSKAWLAAGKQ